MKEHINGFELDVTLSDGIPHVRVQMKDGATVLDTDKLSIIGLENLAAVLSTAARMATEQVDRYWARTTQNAMAGAHNENL